MNFQVKIVWIRIILHPWFKAPWFSLVFNLIDMGAVGNE